MTETRTEYQREEFRRLTQAERAIRLVATVVAIAVGFACYSGLRDIIGGKGLASGLLPATLAICGSLLLSTLWHVLLRNTPLSPHPDKRMRLIGLAAVLTVGGMVFSAWPVATTIAGSAAITEHFKQYYAHADNALLAANKRVASQAGLINDVDRAATEFEGAAQNEASNGAVGGGARGRGPIAIALAATAEQLRAVSRQQRSALDARNAENVVARRLTRNMLGLVADTSLTSAERQQEFAELSSKLSDAIAAINSTDLTAPLNAINVGILYKPASVSGSQAIEQARQSLEHFVDDLRTRAKRSEDLDDAPLAPFEPLNAGIAVIQYFDAMFPAWGIACGLDCLPFVMLMALVTIHTSVRKHYDPASVWGAPDETLYPEPPLTVSSNAWGKSGTVGDLFNIDLDRKKPTPVE